jgi:hypothetical protein
MNLMKKMYFLFNFIFISFVLNAQTKEEIEAKKIANLVTTSKTLKDGWKKTGSLNFNLNEAGVNDAWKGVKGGETQAIGIRSIIDYDIDYKKGSSTWLNNVRARYGLSKLSSAGNGFVKTDDYLSITSIYGRELKPKWSAAFLFNLESQFDKFFLSPGYLKFGPGLLYRSNNNFSALFSPAMGNITTKFATEQKPLNLFSVDSGKTARVGLGAFLQIKADYNIAKGINYKGFATMYSNYLNAPGSIILDWTNLFTLTVNKYIGATISINVRNNDFETNGTQIQRALGIGFSYSF